MTTNEWLLQNYKHVTITDIVAKNTTILTVPHINVELTVGLLTTKDKQEFQKLVIALCPIGTIIEDIPDEWYEKHLLLARNYMNVRLIGNDRETKRLLDVMERINKETWSKESSKTVEVKNNPTDNTMTIKFEVKE